MRTIIAVVTTTESGDVSSVTLTDESTYQTVSTTAQQIVGGVFDAPSLSSGFYDTSEHYRGDLGAWLNLQAHEVFGLSNPHGDELVYVSDMCSTYVYRLDFDGVSMMKVDPKR